ncbi:hypothetical protein C7Y71_003895 [Pseudoprevotella muciniphila]|uniref:Uncharacterized protein n=1 Tax=Pseudoprevotella muciniphila TaxID=2133944 RepID=A0A5P8E5J1_9BACT|nr:hypothetical protein C7Y71_003895 [Pseudoprevotella muciniphila]
MGSAGGEEGADVVAPVVGPQGTDVAGRVCSGELTVDRGEVRVGACRIGAHDVCHGFGGFSYEEWTDGCVGDAAGGCVGEYAVHLFCRWQVSAAAQVSHAECHDDDGGWIGVVVLVFHWFLVFSDCFFIAVIEVIEVIVSIVSYFL